MTVMQSAPATLIDPTQKHAAASRGMPPWLLVSIVLAALVLIVAVVYLVACWRAQAVLNREIDLIRERGEPVFFAEFAPARDDDAVARGKRVAALLTRFQHAPTQFLQEVLKETLSRSRVKQVELFIEPYRADVAAIIADLCDGDCRFEYDYQTREPYDILLSHVQNMRAVSLLLATDCLAALTEADRPRAIERLHDLFVLDGALRDDPCVVSHRNRIANGDRILAVLQTALARQALNEADLQIIDEWLDKLEKDFRLETCLRGERALVLAEMENLGRESMARVMTYNPGGLSQPKAAALNRWWGSWLYRPRRLSQEAVMLRTMSRWADLIDHPGPQATAQYAATESEINENDFPIVQLFVTKGWNVASLRERGLTYRQRLISARLGIAAAVHRMRHGGLPASLDELHDSPLGRPMGLISGKPLVYQPAADGFAIYDELPEQGHFEVRFSRDETSAGNSPP